MKTIFVKATLGAVASLLVGRIAIAQNVEEVSVQAKRGLTTKVVGRTSSGLPLVDISLSHDASAAGLDLASNAGAAELERRVNDAAGQLVRKSVASTRMQRQAMRSAPRQRPARRWSRRASSSRWHRASKAPGTSLAGPRRRRVHLAPVERGIAFPR